MKNETMPATRYRTTETRTPARWGLIGLCWVLVTASSAQESAVATQRHTLWRVTSGECAVYLQGSMHLLRDEHYPLDPAIEQAFEESEALVLEVDLGVFSDPAMQVKLLTNGVLPGGGTLESRLKPETYQLAQEKVESLGLNMILFRHYKPWFFAISLTSLKLNQLGFEPASGIDFHFYGKAREAGKEVRGLETMEYQLSLFDGLSAETQDAIVRQTMEDLDILEQELERLLQAWQAGDVALLEAVLLKSFEGYPDVYRALVTDRNRNWMPVIEDLLGGDRTVMLVVGAGHMVGEEGLIRMLERKGYRVEQL